YSSRKTTTVHRIPLAKWGGSPHVHTARYGSSVSAAWAHCSKKPAPEQARKGAVPQQRVLVVMGVFWYKRALARESLQRKGLTALRRHSRAKGLTARNRAIPTTRSPRRHRGPFRSVCRTKEGRMRVDVRAHYVPPRILEVLERDAAPYGVQVQHAEGGG